MWLQKTSLHDQLAWFVKEVATAFEALHNQGFAQQAVQLPKSCFSKELKAVLSALARTCRVRHLPEFYKGSVMHKVELTAGEKDWMQLGLLLGWVTYHSKQSGICYYDVRRQEVPEE